ncbi:helix-turn-helix transcriptional regulator [Bacillus sp. DX1.1]|uniref:helix-turn-helix transcriptional regulator n=1 Tax=unclassified Bacillus (in: firmicutes) TaxID=185979 RepID=UPI002570F6B4|nr:MULTISPECIES: helix-turn-helix transcriptional regulator [unclassified Bacillus (in: firmicutes)]MDM5156924.1 helix-turn-helix transcriptional regulator [Bacillus sp. DX1.1]WJE81166.1 helix-turn-helix transcriptional regulator [Bacillus sp. DX3.1]
MGKKGTLQNNLYLLRAERRWSQKYVAEMLGVSRQTIHSLESNKYNPSLMLAFQIAKLFEVEITDIFQYLEE